MNYSTESLCRICLVKGATIPIFEESKSEDGVHSTLLQSKLTLCLNEKLENVAGYPRYICESCEVTLNAVVDFINKYKESCRILQKGLQVIVKQEDIEYESNDDFNYPDDDTFEIYESEPSKKKIKIEFEDGENFIAKIKPLCKFNANEKKKSKKGTPVNKKTTPIKKNSTLTNKKTTSIKKKLTPLNTKTTPIKKETTEIPRKNIISKINTNSIRSSLLEGDFVWNGEEWCPIKPSNKEIKHGIEKIKPQAENEKNITQHQPKPETKPAESILCEACGETFENRMKLKLHEEKKHKNLSTCPTCKTTLSSVYYLQRHMKRLHSDTKDFICSKCGRGFAYQKDLNCHIKVVHKRLGKRVIPRVPCKLCGRDYANKNALRVHERAAHTGERPAVCTVCDASFYSEEYLKQHMRLHTGECPYKCPVCGRGYSQSCNMKSHMRNHRISELDQETLSKIKPSWHKFMKP